MRARRSVICAALGLTLTGCASHTKAPVTCTSSIGEQNDALAAAIKRHFGQQPRGYNTLIKAPRSKDAQGNIVLESYRIYPISSPEPELRPEGRKLTVVFDPCRKRVLSAREPA